MGTIELGTHTEVSILVDFVLESAVCLKGAGQDFCLEELPQQNLSKHFNG